MKKFSIKLGVLFFIILFLFALGLGQAADVDWTMFSKNVVRALQSNNPGLQQSAMQLVVKYGPKLDTKDAVFDVMRIYRNDRNQQVRRLALMTLTKMQSEWATNFLKREIQYEGDPVIRKQLIALTSEPGIEMAGQEETASAGADFDRLQEEVSTLSNEEAHYLLKIDSEGQSLDAGQGNYVLYFEKDKYPPVQSFWSMAVYNADTQELVANPLNNYPIQSPLMHNINRDADGGLTFYIQKDSPGGSKQSNWLPTPEGKFYVLMRLYWPEKAVLDGSWAPPQIKKAK